MDIDRETAIEIAVSLGAVAIFLAALIAIGASFGNGNLGRTGALAIVGTIVFFVVIMSGVGYWLAGVKHGQ